MLERSGRQVKPNDITTPAILKCEDDWKVSPHGPDDGDRDCFWVDTYQEALEAVEELGGVTDDGSEWLEKRAAGEKRGLINP